MGVCSVKSHSSTQQIKEMSCDKYLHGGNITRTTQNGEREISATDGYYTQYVLSTYLSVPKSVIDLFLNHCAKICIFNSEKEFYIVTCIQIYLGKTKLACQKKKRANKQKPHDLASKLAQLSLQGP